MDARLELEALLDIRARRRLLTFIPQITPTYKPPLHLAPLVERLELSRVAPLRDLSSVPPRHGKTETIMHAIAWLMAQAPEKTHAYATYADKLTADKSRKIRRYALQAGVQLAKGSRAVNIWRTTAGGGLLATSVGGALTGQGVDGLMVVDDPFKDREQAESVLIRDKVWDWFTNVVFTRLEPGASCIVNMTRWHDDDLIGRLERAEGMSWSKINLPAVRDEDALTLGDDEKAGALWPQHYPPKRLREIRTQIGEYAWQSLFMGRPTSKSGAIFKRAWFDDPANRLDLFPKVFDSRILAVDSSWGESTGADYSVIETWGRIGPLFFLLDVWRKRVEMVDLVHAIVEANSKIVDQFGRPTGADAICIEASSAGLGALQILRRETPLPAIGVAVHQSKTLRAESIATLFEAGRVKLPRSAPWLPVWIEEHCMFPNGAHDDQVDTTSLGLRRMLDVHMWGGNDKIFTPSHSRQLARMPSIFWR